MREMSWGICQSGQWHVLHCEDRSRLPVATAHGLLDTGELQRLRVALDTQKNTGKTFQLAGFVYEVPGKSPGVWTVQVAPEFGQALGPILEKYWQAFEAGTMRTCESQPNPQAVVRVHVQ